MADLQLLPQWAFADEPNCPWSDTCGTAFRKSGKRCRFWPLSWAPQYAVPCIGGAFLSYDEFSAGMCVLLTILHSFLFDDFYLAAAIAHPRPT